MGFFGLIPFGVILVFSLVAFFAGRFYGRKYGKRLKQIEETPLVKGRDVAGHVNDVCKMHGEMVAPGGTLESPIDGLSCVWYRLTVEEQQTREERESGTGKIKKEKVWATVIDASKMVPAGIADKDGAVEVSLAEAEMLIKDGAKKTSGFFTDVPARLRALIEEEYGYDSTLLSRLRGKQNLRIKEQVLEVGEKALVVGKVKLIRTDRGVRPRFVRGKQPLLVTDKNDKELRGHYGWAVFWSNAGVFGGAGVGAWALLMFLWVLYAATVAALYAPAKGSPVEALAEMRQNDKWRRIRAMEALEKGPGGLAGEQKAEVRKALLERLAEQDADVAKRAAAVLPAWVEKEDVPSLVKALDHKEGGVRQASIKMLGQLKDPAAAEALAAQFDKDPDLVADALKAVGADLKPVAAKHLFSPNERLRGASLKLLEGLPKEGFEGLAAANVFAANQGVRDQAVRVLNDSPNKARRYADQAVKEVAGKAGTEQDLALDWLNKNRPAAAERAAELRGPPLAVVQTGKGRMLGVAADLLVPIAAKEQAAELVKLAAPKNPVAKQAVAALGRVGGADEAYALAKLLNDRGLSGEASRALKGMKDTGGEAGVLKFLAEKGYENKAVATEACRILEAIGTAAAVPALEELAKDKDRTLNSAAKKAMAAVKK